MRKYTSEIKETPSKIKETPSNFLLCIFSRHAEKIYTCIFSYVYVLDTRRKYTCVDLLVYIFSGQKENKGGEVGEVRYVR